MAAPGLARGRRVSRRRRGAHAAAVVRRWPALRRVVLVCLLALMLPLAAGTALAVAG